MSAKMIANLKSGDDDEPIDIKVIRKWNSFGKKGDCCFIFIDKNGDAIQASGSFSEKNYFDSIIKIDTCYCLSNYICEDAKTSMMTVPHDTGIRIGKAAKFQQIPSDGFPVYYFNLIQYDELFSRLDNHILLTDYIGRMEHVTDVFYTNGTAIRKMKLESLSEMIIQATFWDDIALSFNKEATTSLPSPVIIAVTSMKVTQFNADLQLTSMPASYIYVNPEIQEAKLLAAQFREKIYANPFLKIQYEKSKNPQTEKHRNRFTLAQLLAQNPSRYVLGFTDRYSLPKPLVLLKGKTKIFQIRFGRWSRPGAVDFVVDRVFHDTVLLEKKEPTTRSKYNASSYHRSICCINFGYDY